MDLKIELEAMEWIYLAQDRDSWRAVTDKVMNLLKVKQSRFRPLSGPEGSRKLRCSHFMTTAQDGGKVVSLTHRPPLPPENTHGTHFC